MQFEAWEFFENIKMAVRGDAWNVAGDTIITFKYPKAFKILTWILRLASRGVRVVDFNSTTLVLGVFYFKEMQEKKIKKAEPWDPALKRVTGSWLTRFSH